MYFASDKVESKYVCLPINILYVRIKKDKGSDYVLSWKSKGVYTSKHKLYPL